MGIGIHLRDPVDGTSIFFTGDDEEHSLSWMLFDLAAEFQITMLEIFHMAIAAATKPEHTETEKLLRTAEDDSRRLDRPDWLTVELVLDIWQTHRDGLLYVAGCCADLAKKAKIEALVEERETAMAQIIERAKERARCQ